MEKLLLYTGFASLLLMSAQAQTLTAPQAEGIYGGRIHGISAMSLGADSTRLVVSTESANSLFYADVQSTNIHSLLEIGSFTPVTGADMDDGYGSSVRNPVFHETSGQLFFVSNGQLHRIDPEGGSASSIGNAEDVVIDGNYLFYTEMQNVHFGTLDASANFTASGSSPIAFSTSPAGRPSLHIDPVTGLLHVFTDGANPEIYVSSTATTSFGAATTFTSLSFTATSGMHYGAYNIAPDGTLYMMGNHYPSGSANSDFIEVAYSTSAGLSWSSYTITGSGPGPHVGIIGPNIEFAGNASAYYMYNGATYNNNSGDSASWYSFGSPGGLYGGYAPNGGVVLCDPNNDSLVYFTTDVALGYSSDYGATTKPLNDGITAVQVYDMDMTSDYNTGWVASKSGIRKVSNYKSTPIWSPTKFPNGDGSPYYAVDMANDDTNTVFAGSVRIYKTTNSGSSWSLMFDPANSIFTQVGTHCRALEVNPWATSVIMAGFANEHSGDGGLFISDDGGSTWNQILIDAASGGSDVDVYDIIFTDTNTAYIGVGYDLAAPTGRSIYKIVHDPSTSTLSVSQDMNASGTATGTSITAQIYDLELSPSGDTLFAAGTDAGANHPICYFKDFSGTAKWEVISTSGFPSGSNDVASAVTIGDGVVFCAVNSDIYTYDLTVGSTWSVGYNYPIGTQINFLFYDELLVGTGTGLYAQDLNPGVGIEDFNLDASNRILNLYPNPAHQYINLELQHTHQELKSLKLYHYSGRALPLVIVEMDASHALINVKPLKPGTYILQVETGEQSYYQRLLIE